MKRFRFSLASTWNFLSFRDICVKFNKLDLFDQFKNNFTEEIEYKDDKCLIFTGNFADLEKFVDLYEDGLVIAKANNEKFDYHVIIYDDYLD